MCRRPIEAWYGIRIHILFILLPSGACYQICSKFPFFPWPFAGFTAGGEGAPAEAAMFFLSNGLPSTETTIFFFFFFCFTPVDNEFHYYFSVIRCRRRRRFSQWQNVPSIFVARRLFVSLLLLLLYPLMTWRWGESSTYWYHRRKKQTIKLCCWCCSCRQQQKDIVKATYAFS